MINFLSQAFCFCSAFMTLRHKINCAVNCTAWIEYFAQNTGAGLFLLMNFLFHDHYCCIGVFSFPVTEPAFEAS